MNGLSEPLHVAIIMDGNGRWAKKRGMPRSVGHRKGVSTVKKIVTHAVKSGIGVLSMFAFSTENWLRPDEEVSLLMNLLDDYIRSEWKSVLENNIKFIVSGDLNKIPEKTKSELLKLQECSVNSSGMILNLVISYGGREEIAKAAKSMAHDVQKGLLNLDDIDEKTFTKYLYNPDLPDVDLLIRSSGEHRVSNFMLWRIAYSELYFTDTLWPDFSIKDFDKAVTDFNKRVRRFGKTDEQINK